jgi:hypothetical protein
VGKVLLFSLEFMTVTPFLLPLARAQLLAATLKTGLWRLGNHHKGLKGPATCANPLQVHLMGREEQVQGKEVSRRWTPSSWAFLRHRSWDPDVLSSLSSCFTGLIVRGKRLIFGLPSECHQLCCSSGVHCEAGGTSDQGRAVEQ